MPRQKKYGISIIQWQVLFLFVSSIVHAQTYTVQVRIKGISDDAVVAGYVKGNEFIPVDTIFPEEETVKYFLQEGDHTGIYRLILSKTLYEQVMKKPSRKIDFIFNKENIQLETAAKTPLDSMVVISSDENRIWYIFFHAQEKIDRELSILEKQLDYSEKNPGILSEEARRKMVVQYNLLQRIREKLIGNLVEEYPATYAAKIVRLYKRPFLNGEDPKVVRDSVFRKQFFGNLDFSDPALIYSPVYPACISEYIEKSLPAEVSQAKEKIEVLNVLVDNIIENATSNREVGDFIINYLLKSFERMGLWGVLSHIADRYGDKVRCDLAEKTTFQRRVCYLRMHEGNRVPDLSLQDSDGEPVSLSEIGSKYKLVVFWMSTCPHCEELLPRLYSWYMTRDVDLEVIAVSLDADEKRWRDYIREKGFNWINCWSRKGWDSPVANEYNIYATPTMFLLNEKNEIIGKPLVFDDFIDLLLKIKKKNYELLGIDE